MRDTARVELAALACACVLAACSMDIAALQRGSDAGHLEPATDPGGAGGAGTAGEAMSAGTGGAAGTLPASAGAGAGAMASADAGVKAAPPAAGSGGMPPMDSPPSSAGKPQRSCGVPGLACCPGNLCDIGACLRGKCTAYGGFYAHTAGCALEPCSSRNAYTAGCSCPLGFDDTLLYERSTVCEDGDVAATEVRSCTSGRVPNIAFAGVWVEGPDDRCNVGCRTPNPITGSCNCPSGTQALALNVDTTESGCPNASMTLQLCVDADGDAINFGGAYAVSQSAALGCSAPNPLTAACSCPESAAMTLPQSLHVGNWSIFVCNL